MRLGPSSICTRWVRVADMYWMCLVVCGEEGISSDMTLGMCFVFWVCEGVALSIPPTYPIALASLRLTTPSTILELPSPPSIVYL